MLRLDGTWVWDSWPLRVGGTYHLFFLHSRGDLGHQDLRHVEARIGHATSTDLRSWERLPDPIAPGPPGSFDDVACWTGSTVRDAEGRWHLLYTGITVLAAGGRERQRIGRAVSDDGLDWRKVDGPCFAADPRWYELAGESSWPDEHWRDPWVFADPAGDGWHVLVTARAAAWSALGVPDGDRGVLGHAWSPDLEAWQVRPPRSSPGAGFGHLEVPQLVTFDGRTHLLFGCQPGQLAPWKRAQVGAVGHWILPDVAPLGPYDVARAVPLSDDSLYAGHLVVAPDGQLVLVAFVNREEDGVFAGVISDPLPVGIGPDGPTRVLSAPPSAPR